MSLYNAQSFKLMKNYEGNQLSQNISDTQFAILNGKTITIYCKNDEKIINIPSEDIKLFDGSLLTIKIQNELYF